MPKTVVRMWSAAPEDLEVRFSGFCLSRQRKSGDFWVADRIERASGGKNMVIRRGEERDLTGINRLLEQVLAVHHNGRPDLFKSDTKKYTDEELLAILCDEKRPVFVASDDDGNVMGYAFCVFTQHFNDNILTDIRTLYIDDLCVDESLRGKHIGRSLYAYVLEFARREGCYNLTLNVWECNQGAKRFYEGCGLVPQKTGMEKIL